MDCLFCKIISGEIPSKKVYEDDLCYAFYDINPVAPVHVLVIPKKHIESLDKLEKEDGEIISHIMLKIKEIANQLRLENGYRVVTNIGEDGQQSVKHLHFHLIGGRKLKWEF